MYSTNAPVPRAFQSTLPARGSDSNQRLQSNEIKEISIHAPRKGERRGGNAAPKERKMISIHAPRKGERHGRGASPSSC